MVNNAAPFGKWPFGYNPFGSAFKPAASGNTHTQSLTFTANTQATVGPKQVNSIRIFTSLNQTIVPLKAVSGVVFNFTALAKLSFIKAVSRAATVFTAVAQSSILKQAGKLLNATGLAKLSIQKQANSNRLFTALAQSTLFKAISGRTYNFTSSAIETTIKQVSKIYGTGADTNGLILWYWLGDGPISSGGSVTDYSVSADTGTVANGNLTSSGIIIPSLNFGGTSYITLASVSQLQFTPGSNAFTLMAWIETTATDAAIFSFRDAGSTLIDFVIGNNGLGNAGSGKPSCIMRDSGGTNLNDVIAAAAVNDGNPHHVAFTFDTSQNMQLYIDGVASGASAALGASTIISPTTANSAIGSERANSSLPTMNGDIGDVRVYNRALPTSEINSIYQTNGSKAGGSFLVKAILSAMEQRVSLRTYTFTALAQFSSIKQTSKTLIETALAKLLLPLKQISKNETFTTLAQITKNIVVSRTLIFTALAKLTSIAAKSYFRTYTFTVTAIASPFKQANIIRSFTSNAVLTLTKQARKVLTFTASANLTETAQKVFLKTYNFTTTAIASLNKLVGKIQTFTGLVSSTISTQSGGTKTIIASVAALVTKNVAVSKTVGIFTPLANLTYSAQKVFLKSFNFTALAQLTFLAQKMYLRAYNFTAIAVASLAPKQINKLIISKANTVLTFTKTITKSALVFTALAKLSSQAQKVFLRLFTFTPFAVLTYSIQKMFVRIYNFTALAESSLAPNVLKLFINFTANAILTLNRQIAKSALVFAALAKLTSQAQKVFLRVFNFQAFANSTLLKQIFKVLTQQVLVIAQVFKEIIIPPFVFKALAQLQNTKQANKFFTSASAIHTKYQNSVGNVVNFTIQAFASTQNMISRTLLFSLNAVGNLVSASKIRIETLLFTLRGFFTWSEVQGGRHFQLIVASVIATAQKPATFLFAAKLKIKTVMQSVSNVFSKLNKRRHGP